MPVTDLDLLAFGLMLAAFGILPAILALRAEQRRAAVYEARMAQIAAILSPP